MKKKDCLVYLPYNITYNPIKTSFLAVVFAPVPFYHFGHDFNWCSIFTVIFSFERGLNGQNYHSSGSHQLIKNFFP